MNTSARARPAAASSSSSSCPERPTNGRPCSSSHAPRRLPDEQHVGRRAALAGHDVGRFLADRETAAAMAPYLLVQGVQRRQGDGMLAATLLTSAALLARPGVPGDVPGTAGLAARGDRLRQGDDALRRLARERVRLPRRRAHGPGRRARPRRRRGAGPSASSGRAGELYVAGGPTGFGYVYDARTGADRGALDFDGTFVNDVIVTRRAAYFTDSNKPFIYVYPRGRRAREPVRAADHRRLRLRTGPQRQRHRRDARRPDADPRLDAARARSTPPTRGRA